MVVQLLRGFVDSDLIDDLDLDGMTRENAKFHSDTGKRRESDMVWRIPRHSGGETYLLVLLEFQSTSDPWMALRILVYVGLLWQHLVKEGRLLPDGRLPPVLPIVVYNGKKAWAASDTLRPLIGLEDGSRLWQWQPNMGYYVIDEGRFGDEELAKREGLVALLFGIESVTDRSQVVALFSRLAAWFAANPAYAKLGPLFVELFRGAASAFVPGLRFPDEMSEVRNMLAENMKEWWLQSRQEGRQVGLQEGRQEGRQEGKAELLQRLLDRRFGLLPGLGRSAHNDGRHGRARRMVLACA
jgi:hypothetical protein